MLDNFEVCKIEVFRAEEREQIEERHFWLRPGIFQNLRKTSTRRFKKLSKTQVKTFIGTSW